LSRNLGRKPTTQPTNRKEFGKNTSRWLAKRRAAINSRPTSCAGPHDGDGSRARQRRKVPANARTTDEGHDCGRDAVADSGAGLHGGDGDCEAAANGGRQLCGGGDDGGRKAAVDGIVVTLTASTLVSDSGARL